MSQFIFLINNFFICWYHDDIVPVCVCVCVVSFLYKTDIIISFHHLSNPLLSVRWMDGRTVAMPVLSGPTNRIKNDLIWPFGQTHFASNWCQTIKNAHRKWILYCRTKSGMIGPNKIPTNPSLKTKTFLSQIFLPFSVFCIRFLFFSPVLFDFQTRRSFPIGLTRKWTSPHKRHIFIQNYFFSISNV